MQIETRLIDVSLGPREAAQFRPQRAPAAEVQAVRAVENTDNSLEEELGGSEEQNELRQEQSRRADYDYLAENRRLESEERLMRELEQVQLEASSTSYQQAAAMQNNFVVILGSLTVDTQA